VARWRWHCSSYISRKGRRDRMDHISVDHLEWEPDDRWESCPTHTITANPNLPSGDGPRVPHDDDEEEEEHILDRLITSRLGSGAEARIKLLKWFWLIALAMMLAGFGLMVLLLTGNSPFG